MQTAASLGRRVRRRSMGLVKSGRLARAKFLSRCFFPSSVHPRSVARAERDWSDTKLAKDFFLSWKKLWKSELALRDARTGTKCSRSFTTENCN